KEMGYNSSRYIHTLYQTMNLAYADRDFYYGDPYFAPEEPMQGLLSKEYAKERAKLIRYDQNDPAAAPGDPYPFEGKTNPYTDLLKKRFGPGWGSVAGSLNTSDQISEISRESNVDNPACTTTSVKATAVKKAPAGEARIDISANEAVH